MVFKLAVHFGCDIDISWNANEQGDFKVISDLENAEQAVYNRLLTKLGELTPLGSPRYGNQAFEVLGETNQKVAKQKIILFTRTCLLQDPRVNNIISITATFNFKSAEVQASVQLIGEDTPSNLVIIFGEES